MTRIYVEYALHSIGDGLNLRLGNSIFEVRQLDDQAINEIRSTLHQQAIEHCQENAFSLPHSRASTDSTYLQIVTIAQLRGIAE